MKFEMAEKKIIELPKCDSAFVQHLQKERQNDKHKASFMSNLECIEKTQEKKHKNARQSSMATFDLPEDIERDILSRLPVKSLLRFRSVSKSWCSLLKNPDFIAENHNYATLNSPYDVLVLQEGKKCAVNLDCRFSVVPDVSVDDDDEIVPVFTPFFFEYPVIKGSVNGLICLHDEVKDLIVLWNPATREFKPIPYPQFKPLPGSIEASTSDIGFGFDKKTNDYKILRFVLNRFDNIVGYKDQVQLYSLKNDSWKEISSVDDHLITASVNEMWFNPYVDGVCYWWGVGAGMMLFVLSFDFANEVFEKLLIPGSRYSLFDMDHRSQLAIINGMLSVVRYKHEKDEEKGTIVTCFDMFAMTRHGVKESWKAVESPFAYYGYVKPVGTWKNYLLLRNLDDEKLVLCRFSTGEVYNFQLHGNIQVSYYVESLVPINGR